ncbi:MAG: WPE palindromic element domain-containing protein [Wolbachia sp.]
MPRHWDPGKLIVNEQTFSIKLPKSWIPVSATCMTPFAVQFTFKNECSYSYEFIRGISA